MGNDLASRIRAKRLQDNISLRESGEQSGVAFSTLARVENGAQPSVKAYAKIVAWLDGLGLVLPPPPMTLRDWFAGQALCGLLASPFDGPNQSLEVNAAHFANVSYVYADAMIANRVEKH